MQFEPIIGLEVHAQLLTASKIFCHCSTKFGSAPNIQVCPVCLGLPGTLPILNEKAVEFAIKLGLATNCQIAPYSTFARKNYFYPDLPKGYQISQYDEPLCVNGVVDIETDEQIIKIRICRIHLEEDAGKSVHAEHYVAAHETLIDFNRCGIPLIEIVSEPDLHSPQEAHAYLVQLRRMLQYLEISDGNMEQGHFRCDANISMRQAGEVAFGVKTEMKNMNSFRSLEKALEFEIQRQSKILANGGTIRQETLTWDEKNNIAIPMRSKEMAHDYRYFPEPDLLPLTISRKWIDEINQSIPELSLTRRNRLIAQFQLPLDEANMLTEQKSLADYFEAVAQESTNPALASHWILGDVFRTLKERKIEISEFPISAHRLSELLNLIDSAIINESIGRAVFNEMLTASESPGAIIARRNLAQVSDNALLQQIVDKVIADHPAEVKLYLSGKKTIFGFFMGQVMQKSNGKANPQIASQLLFKTLDALKNSYSSAVPGSSFPVGLQIIIFWFSF